MARSSPSRFDVFLSHNSRDKVFVREIAGKLRQAGLEPFLDDWDLLTGEPWERAIIEHFRNSSSCAVLIGAHGAGSWQAHEILAACERASSDAGFRIFAVLLPGISEPFDPTMMPPELSARNWVDLRSGLDDP